MKIRHSEKTSTYIFDGPGGRTGTMLGIQSVCMLGISTLAWFGAYSAITSGKIGFALTLGLVCAGMGVGFLLMALRLLARISRREQLQISADGMTVRRFVNGRTSVVRYPFDQMEDLWFLGDEDFSALPGDGIQSMASEGPALGLRVNTSGSIAFRHNGHLTRFGVGVPSWDAEKIDTAIQERTAGRLRMAGLPEEIPEHHWNR